MDRRDFLKFGTAAGLFGPLSCGYGATYVAATETSRPHGKTLEADLVIVGGGLGGCAAALAALRNGLRVILTEETDWIGGQATSQGVPPDENPWIETHGSTQSYRNFRTAVRNYYKANYPLTEDARKREHLNPGDGGVSRICLEPRVALAVLYQLFNPYLSSGRLTLLLEHYPVSAGFTGDTVESVRVRNARTENELVLVAPYFIDATELGELLPMTQTEHVRGAESRNDTNELHALEKADPENQQAFTLCFAMDYVPGANLVIDKPREYDFWRDFVPEMTPPWSGKLLSLTYSQPTNCQPITAGFNPENGPTGGGWNIWNYRRIINMKNYPPGTYTGDATIANWPQNDYLLGNLDGTKEEFAKHVARAEQLSLSLFYWLQTEVPRHDGGTGWPGLRLRGDLLGTENGMAKYPYVREARRIKALFTVLEEHVGKEQRESITGKEEKTAAPFYDSVGIGYYRLDLHPSTKGNNYIDFASLPYQIPLGALIPQRMKNLLPANKNIGTTHITNGNFRLHPVEWNIGESVGTLAFFAMQKKTTPQSVRSDEKLLDEFQKLIRSQGVLTEWKL